MTRFMPVLAFALTAMAQEPSFEVASIRQSALGNRGTEVLTQPGRFRATNITTRELILRAYKIQEVQLAGGPGWIGSQHFDIDARGDSSIPEQQVAAMLARLLAERFKLAVHTEKRETSVFALIPANRDGKLGPKLQPSQCEPKKCGGSYTGVSKIAGTGIAVSQLISMLATATQRLVVDRTSLAGLYDIELTWTPDRMPQEDHGGPPIDPNGPSLFTAIQEQLGLKLESRKERIDTLVIDSIQQPSEN